MRTAGARAERVEQVELPVAVELPGRLGQEVTAYLEREVGWRRVPLDGPPAPALLLTQRPRPWPPSIVVLETGADADTMRHALLQGALDVVVWPDERARLASCARRLPRPRIAPAPARVGVAGAAGGTGTSTVALALGGLAAWSGRRAVVVAAPDVLSLAGIASWGGPGADELDRLAPEDAAREFARVARPAPAVPGLWLLPASAVPVAAGWPADVLVADLGAWPSAVKPDLQVARPDSTLDRIAGLGVPVVIVGAGPRSAADVRRVLGRPPVAWLPYSARVARAACAGRLPAGLPGSFLAALRDGLGWRS